MLLNNWTLFFREMKSIGKFLVKDDLSDVIKLANLNLNDISPLDQWQYGAILWWASEVLSLLNFFFPFDKQIEKNRLQQKIQEIETMKNRNTPQLKINGRRFQVAK